MVLRRLRSRMGLLGCVTASLFLLSVAGLAQADFCTDNNPLASIMTIGTGTKKADNLKVSHSVVGNIIDASKVGPKTPIIKVCAGTFVSITVTDTTGTVGTPGPVIDVLEPLSELDCVSTGPTTAFCFGTIVGKNKYNARSADGTDIDKMKVQGRVVVPALVLREVDQNFSVATAIDDPTIPGIHGMCGVPPDPAEACPRGDCDIGMDPDVGMSQDSGFLRELVSCRRCKPKQGLRQLRL